MSALGDGLASALRSLDTVSGQAALEYRSGSAGGWSAITGPAFVQPTAAIPTYDEQGGERVTEAATLRIAEGGVALSEGDQIRVGADDEQIWTVTSPGHGVGLTVYEVQRAPLTRIGPDRGRIG